MNATDALTISTTQKGNGVVVQLVGSASMELCDRLNEALYAACESRPRVLVVDLSRLDFICSLGLGGLVAAYLRVQKYGGALLLASPAESIREMLQVTKLGQILPMFDTPAEALASIS